MFFFLRLTQVPNLYCHVNKIVGNPGEVAIVRMANDSKLPGSQRRNYKSSIHACFQIYKYEGCRGLLRGVINSSIRAAVVNGFQLGLYSTAKKKLVKVQPILFKTTSSISTMFCGAMISSFFAVSASMPMDVVKSRFSPYYYQFKAFLCLLLYLFCKYKLKKSCIISPFLTQVNEYVC